MLSFFRFAACPFCNLRIHELVSRYSELGSGFTVVAVFDSPLDNLISRTKRHKAPCPIFADENNRYYNEYGIEHSFYGVLKGMLRRMPALVKGILKGYVPITIKGSLTTMPADFFINWNGTIEIAHYGIDDGDHLLFEEVKAFSLKSQSEELGRHQSPGTRVLRVFS